MTRKIARAKLKAQGNQGKMKKVVAIAATIAAAGQAFANVSVDATSGVLSGSIDMASYNSAMAIMIPVGVTILVGGIILRTLKKA